MAIGVIWASPNANGLTAQCKNRAVAGILAAGKEYQTLQLNTYHLQRCNVCDAGKGTCAIGKCCIEDDFSKLYEQLAKMEAIIWITPVYWHEMAEPMSVFISRIRRSDPLVNHRLQDKKCMIVACAGKSGRGAVRTLYNMEYTMEQLKMEVCERLPVTPLNKSYVVDAIQTAVQMLCEKL